jgi:miniconductance mechanosensitive channel
MILNLAAKIKAWLLGMGLSDDWASGLRIIIEVAIIALVCVIVNFITKEIILVIVGKIVKRSKNNWDDILLEKKVFHRFSHLMPAIIIYYSSKFAFYGHPGWIHLIKTSAIIYLIVVVMFIINAFLKALNEIYLRIPSSKERPIKGFLQVINIFNFAVGAILVLSLLLDKNPGYFLTGIGAIAAILMLVFKDTLLGLVAGIQLSANDMVRIGDWITVPSKGADGTVSEISLHTVKILNWDKTITMVPSYLLVSDSFINFRGLEDSEARRVKRSINIDIKSIHFLSDEEITSLKKIKLIEIYLTEKSKELEKYNSNLSADLSSSANGQRLTNIGTFRKYVELYIKDNPNIRKDMTMIVRQLQSNESGIPIELYFFSKYYEWEPFETLQADVFDHLLAVVPQFGLRVFQSPSGFDFQSLGKEQL